MPGRRRARRTVALTLAAAALALPLTEFAEAANPFSSQGRRLESPLPEPPPPPPAPVYSDVFTFRLCNKSRVKIAAAIARKVAVDDARFMVSGWYIVDRGDCSDLGPFPKGWFYFYGEKHNSGGSTYWGSNDLKLCVAYPGPFDRINVDNYRCKKREKLKGFYSHYVEESEDIYTFNMNP